MTTTQEPDTATAPATATAKEILVNVVLDRSGSMQSCQDGTISGYNEYLKGLKADKDNNYNVSLIQFDTPANQPELTVSYVDKPLADVPELNNTTYQPRGMTPLYDAIGECVRRVDAKSRGVLTVIITDGMENASQEFNLGSIKKLISEKEAEGWEFIFLGANIDSAAVGGSMGIAATDCANYMVGNEASVYANVSNSAMRYASATTSHGVGSAHARMMACFTVDERNSMIGGRPAEPSTFHIPATVHIPSIVTNPTGSITFDPAKTKRPTNKPRTQWKVRS